MAYASLVIVSDVIDRIMSCNQEHIPVCDKEQLQSLNEKVVSLKKILEDMSRKLRSSSMIEELESQIRDAAYKMEDIVEPILLRSLADQEDEVEIDEQLGSPVPTAAAFASCVEEVDRLLEKSMEMKKVFDNNVASGTISSHATSSSVGPPSSTETKVGLGDVLNQILHQVNGREPTLQVIPITGMGGIGKTTLARAVFEDPGNCFDIRLWATVSQEYDIQEILKHLAVYKSDVSMLEQLEEPQLEEPQLEEPQLEEPQLEEPQLEEPPEDDDLIVRVHKRLIGRRYLVVLDDIWDENVWDGVRNAFPDDEKSSRVVLTTRLSKVATYVCSSLSHAHQMQLLNNEESWNLMREKVYGLKPCPREFEGVGRAISRNCKGLPLALDVTAGLLKSNMIKKDYWEEVAERTAVEAAENDDSLLEILSFSYRNLPPHLKACFLYMGAFGEDKEISISELVMLWTAEGFLKQIEPTPMEEFVEECLKELAERNLVSVVKKSSLGKTRTSSIHDALRDLSLREARREKFLCHLKERAINDDTFQKIIESQHRVSISYSGSEERLFKNCPAHVRTYLDPSNIYVNVEDTPRCKLLRVLRKVYIRDESSLGFLYRQLSNLRYLHLELDWVQDMAIDIGPISMLPNLEALIVTGGGRQRNTPRYNLILSQEIWEMPRLRHIHLIPRSFLVPPESKRNEFSLESLQSLCDVTDLHFTREVVGKIPNVKKLKLVYMFQWNDEFLIDPNSPGEPYYLDNLIHLRQLEVLSIRCGYSNYKFAKVRGFAFPDQLKKLTLLGTKIAWEDMSAVGSLPNLQVLKLQLKSAEGDVWEPTEGEFPQLKYLKLSWLQLREWRADDTHFPCLEKLFISDCWFLEEVPASIGDIYTLQKLIVRDIPDSVDESVRRLRKEQRGLGNSLLRVYILSHDNKVPE